MPKPKETKKEEAQQRQKRSSGRSPREQLRRLDQKFGKGKGAEKERARLHKKIKNRGK